jgi:Family of unknown function (DUF6188)
MYDLRADFDLEQFVGKSLEMVSFGTYKVDLHLSGGYLIEIEDDISLNSDEAVDLPAVLELLYPLVNRDIRTVARSGSGMLSFTFEQGTVLHIHDSSKQYECYSISLKGETLARV